MAKKAFGEGLDALFSQSSSEQRDEFEKKPTITSEAAQALKKAKVNKEPLEKTTAKQAKALEKSRDEEKEPSSLEEIRFTCISKRETVEKIKALAFWERINIKDVVEMAFEAYIAKKGARYTEEALKEFNKQGKR